MNKPVTDLSSFQKTAIYLFLSLNVVVPIVIAVLDGITLSLNEKYLTFKDQSLNAESLKFFSAKVGFLGVLCALLFLNSAITLKAIFNIHTNVKSTTVGLKTQLSTNQLVLHFLVIFLFAVCVVPLCFFPYYFFGTPFSVCQIVVVTMCALCQLGLLRIFNQICSEAVESLQFYDSILEANMATTTESI